MAEIMVNDESFEQEVIKSELPVLIDFWAEWCGPCRMIAPLIKELAGEYDGKLKVCKINIDEAPETTKKYGIMSIPTIAIIKNGEVVEKVVGAVPKANIIAKINAHLA